MCGGCILPLSQILPPHPSCFNSRHIHSTLLFTIMSIGGSTVITIHVRSHIVVRCRLFIVWWGSFWTNESIHEGSDECDEPGVFDIWAGGGECIDEMHFAGWVELLIEWIGMVSNYLDWHLRERLGNHGRPYLSIWHLHSLHLHHGHRSS